MRLATIPFLLALTLPALAAPGGLPFLHGLFTDAMVLQRDVPCPLWGWTDPGAKVTVAVNGQTATATADAHGKWLVKVGPFPAGGPTTVTVTGPQTVTLKDVLFGDVWLCSGQSNMEFGMKGVDQWWNEYWGADYPKMRLYTVPGDSQCWSPATVTGTWRPCNTEGLFADAPVYGGFSAVAFFFGRKVHQETGVPIGLLESCLGATDIACWSTVASLRKVGGEYADLDPLPSYEKRLTENWKQIDPAYEATKGWSDPAFDATAWKTISLPQSWQEKELPEFTGVVWFRKEVELPAAWAGQDLRMTLGKVDDQDTLWVNGVFCGGYHEGNSPQVYRVPAAAVRAGKNVVALRVLGRTGVTGKPEQFTLLGADADPATLVSLAGPWQYHASTPTAQMKGRQVERHYTPSGCYQAMIEPLAPFAIKGAIWYQGEGDVGRATTYETKLKSLIADWRGLFGVGQFPFYMVQIANFGPPAKEPANSGWAMVREAQAAVTASVPHTGMGLAIDRGEIYNIHPPNKRDVGVRLALPALAQTYGKPVAYEGPRYQGMKVEGNAVRISFDHAEGLVSLGGGPTGLAIAGADGKFVWAQAYLDGETLVVSSPLVPAPTMVHYGWSDNPLCNLYNAAGLPAVPFRTEAPLP